MSRTQAGRLAYAVHLGPGEDEGRVIIVEDGVPGYRPVPDYDCSPASERERIALRLNKRLGVSQKQANVLVARSMMGAV